MRQEFILPKESGDLSGKYNPDYVPYLWGVWAMMDAPEVKILGLMKAAQVGWTFGLVGYLGKEAECNPSNTLILFPKEGAAKEFSDEKLVPCIRSTPAMAKLVDVTKVRKDGQRGLFKKFPGGFWKMAGSNSVSNVKSTPAQRVIVEEPDDTADNVKDQGDAIRLARERLKRQPSGKLMLGGTPSIKGVSRVEEFIELSNQMVLPITCHDCGEGHVLSWENVSWAQRQDNVEHMVFGKHDPDSAVYCCPHCGSIWNDWQRKKNVLDTVKAAEAAGDPWLGWQATADGSGGIYGVKDLSELYVCMPGTSLADVVRAFLEAEHEAAKGDESGRIVFWNSKLAKSYEYKSDAPEAEELSKRAEDYAELTVPHGGLVMTAGVDVQHDRLAVAIWAWGRDEESWLVYWGELAAKTSTIDPRDPVWLELDNLLLGSFRHAAGFDLRLSAVSVDSSDGNTSDAVYTYVRQRQRRGFMAVKGSSSDYGTREIFALPKAVDQQTKTKVAKYGLRTYLVGTFKAKSLLIGGKGRVTLRGNGPGRMHWYKNVRADFYEQLMSEVLIPHRQQRNKFEWRLKSGVRNEALDCCVMALHAARSVKTHSMTPQAWAALEAKLLQADVFGEQYQPPLPAVIDESPPEAPVVPPAAAKKVKAARRGGFVGSWR
jgi:phage terminase large subunit GpA-like protein